VDALWEQRAQLQMRLHKAVETHNMLVLRQKVIVHDDRSKYSCPTLSATKLPLPHNMFPSGKQSITAISVDNRFAGAGFRPVTREQLQSRLSDLCEEHHVPSSTLDDARQQARLDLKHFNHTANLRDLAEARVTLWSPESAPIYQPLLTGTHALATWVSSNTVGSALSANAGSPSHWGFASTMPTHNTDVTADSNLPSSMLRISEEDSRVTQGEAPSGGESMQLKNPTAAVKLPNLVGMHSGFRAATQQHRYKRRLPSPRSIQISSGAKKFRGSTRLVASSVPDYKRFGRTLGSITTRSLAVKAAAPASMLNGVPIPSPPQTVRHGLSEVRKGATFRQSPKKAPFGHQNPTSITPRIQSKVMLATFSKW